MKRVDRNCLQNFVHLMQSTDKNALISVHVPCSWKYSMENCGRFSKYICKV